MSDKTIVELCDEHELQYRALYYWVEQAQEIFPDLREKRAASSVNRPLMLSREEQAWIIPRALGQYECICKHCGASYIKIRGGHSNINSRTLCEGCYKKEVNRRQAKAARLRRTYR